MAREVIDDLRRQEPARTVEVDIAPGLSANADPRLMRIVLENLLRNAWKFSARVEKAQIGFSMVERDGRRVFQVRDNGAGFDMAHAAKLFGPFERLHRQDEFAGTGIGLAIVQRIVRRHGGSVWAEAAVGRGASFFFTLD
jgi:light-regulated signal transduction histidine kinase (bacteriophytochrome)